MARYRRNFIAGGTFFFTVKLADPKSRLLVEHIDLLRAAYMDVQNNIPLKPSPYACAAEPYSRHLDAAARRCGLFPALAAD